MYSLGKSTVSYPANRRRLLMFVFTLSLLALSNQITGPHQTHLHNITQYLVWYGTWVALGAASSIGLGTGLHTFVLFLGPYIVEVTLAAYECHGAELLTRHPAR
jgi:asparagine N-glycosylation enzyme membrane subunit Stt3